MMTDARAFASSSLMIALAVLCSLANAPQAMAEVSSCVAAPTSMPRGTPYSERMMSLGHSMSGHVGLLVVGDSIAHRWPIAQLERHFGGPAVNLAVGGDRLENTTATISAIGAGADPRTIFIVSGTNNVNRDQPCQFDQRMDVLLKTTRDRFPKASIYILSILPKGQRLAAFRENIDAANAYLRQAAVKVGAVYIDGFSTIADGCASAAECDLLEPDHLHPSPAGYARLDPLLSRVVHDQPATNR